MGGGEVVAGGAFGGHGFRHELVAADAPWLSAGAGGPSGLGAKKDSVAGAARDGAGQSAPAGPQNRPMRLLRVVSPGAFGLITTISSPGKATASAVALAGSVT